MFKCRIWVIVMMNHGCIIGDFEIVFISADISYLTEEYQWAHSKTVELMIDTKDKIIKIDNLITYDDDDDKNILEHILNTLQ